MGLHARGEGTATLAGYILNDARGSGLLLFGLENMREQALNDYEAIFSNQESILIDEIE
jgi:hypothetical protein